MEIAGQQAAVEQLTSAHRQPLQRLLESNPDYALLTGGSLPTADAARDVLETRPPGVSAAVKVDLGLWEGPSLMAFADILVGWPAAEIAHIGLLMTDGTRHRRGLGRRMHEAVVAHLVRATDVSLLRITIVDTNAATAEPFWSALGYRPTGEVSPYELGTVSSRARVWTRPLALGAGVPRPRAHRQRSSSASPISSPSGPRT